MEDQIFDTNCENLQTTPEVATDPSSEDQDEPENSGCELAVDLPNKSNIDDQLNMMDTPVVPPLNSGDGLVATENVKCGENHNTDEQLNVMDTSTSPPLNSGDGAVATELLKYGENDSSHIKLDTAPRRRKNYASPRALLPRRSKTRAFESLKTLAKAGRVYSTMPPARRKKYRPRKLNTRRYGKERKYARGRVTKSNTYARRKKTSNRRKPATVRAGKRDSGTSMSTVFSTMTCSTCKSNLSSQYDGAYY